MARAAADSGSWQLRHFCAQSVAVGARRVHLGCRLGVCSFFV